MSKLSLVASSASGTKIADVLLKLATIATVMSAKILNVGARLNRSVFDGPSLSVANP